MLQCIYLFIYLIFWQKQGLPGGSLGSPHLVQGVLPHVAPRQRLVVGEDDGVVLGVGLVAPLPDPAVVVGEGLVKPPGGHSKTGWPSGQAHRLARIPGALLGMASLAGGGGCSYCGVNLGYLLPFYGWESKETKNRIFCPSNRSSSSLWLCPLSATHSPGPDGFTRAGYSPAGGKQEKNRKIYVNSALLGQPQRASLTEPSFKCSPERERAVNIPHIFHPFLPRLKYK